MPKANTKPTTIDEYLARATPKHRALLEKLRRAIHAAAPGAEEYIGYGLAGFKLHGKPLVYLGAWEKHCALYAASPATQAQFHEELKGFSVSKGTIQFTTEKPLPLALVKKLVKARAAENAATVGVKKTAAKRDGKPFASASAADASSVLATLKKLSDPRIRKEMSTRYGIVTRDAFGIRMNEMQKLAKQLGQNHALALALWRTGNYEARMVAIYVAKPEKLTPALMDAWCRDFDNWATCDTACFKLFDRTPHAYRKVAEWAKRKGEFEKRAAFALLASLALHDKQAGNEVFARFFPLVEIATSDERNFVKKSVSWAMRAIGGRNAKLRGMTVSMARKLATSPDAPPRWVGKDVLKALAGKEPA